MTSDLFVRSAGRWPASCIALSLLLTAKVFAINPPAPLSPVPTAAQQTWQDGDLALFLNFGLNTFTGEEQGDGRADPKLFNPTNLDVHQWVKVAKECGFKRIVLPVKNHDGFCLWPSRFSDYSVTNSPWREGRGDLVKEFTDACHAAGLEAGFYLSCEDRHHPAFGTDEYNKVYIGQLTELLSNYGPVSEVRLDGAGGVGSGAYGAIDLPQKKQDYDWQNYFGTIHRLQPQTIIVSVIGPDARWNGNNIGHAGDPLWAPFDLKSVPGPEPTTPDQLKVLNAGDPSGSSWLPPEAFVRTRPHWSWRAEDDTNVLAPDKLFNTYCKSIGRGCVLLLNVPLNRDGLIPDIDVERLHGLHAAVEKMVSKDFIAGKTATAGNVRGNDPVYAAVKAVDSDSKTFWATDDEVTNGCWLEVDLGGPVQFDTSALREPLVFGQRVAAYRIEAWQDNQWKLVVHGTSIGHLKLERFPAVTTDKVRLIIEKSRACPLISQFSLYRRQD
jgi:alpha-L-fucosidase